jgi:two-component system phosphate regulon sensor histidine kinase PhoR
MRLRRHQAALPATPPDVPAPGGSSPGTVDAVSPPDWHRLALESMDAIWLRVDDSMKVAEASAAAVELFGNLSLPQAVISFTRSAEIENHAREALEGVAGPWEVEAARGKRVLRLQGVPLGPAGALLQLQDVTEVRRLEAVRADFVANLAHELRTPVASLSLAAETLSAGLPPEEQQRFVARIAEETTYIEGLLRTVSELAFLEGSVRLQVSEFWLDEVVRESWRRVVDLQGARELDDTVPRDLLLRADRVRVAEIMQNLFENAHRYNPPGSTVHVGASADDGEVQVWVADEGPGIPPTDLPRIFERFYKVDRARTRQGDGSGLGLAICKHLVSAHDGRIWAEAVPSGGTRVSFTIPC